MLLQPLEKKPAHAVRDRQLSAVFSHFTVKVIVFVPSRTHPVTGYGVFWQLKPCARLT